MQKDATIMENAVPVPVILMTWVAVSPALAIAVKIAASTIFVAAVHRSRGSAGKNRNVGRDGLWTSYAFSFPRHNTVIVLRAGPRRGNVILVRMLVREEQTLHRYTTLTAIPPHNTTHFIFAFKYLFFKLGPIISNTTAAAISKVIGVAMIQKMPCFLPMLRVSSTFMPR